MELFLIISAVILGVLVFLFYASFYIDSGIYIHTLCKGKTDKPVVCITFDDGPDEAYTPLVLDVLKLYNVPATFFCIGEKARLQPSLLLRMTREGHRIGNHSGTHLWNFPFYPYQKMKEDILSAQTALQSAGQPVSLFRPPFGITNPTLARVVRELNYTTIGWNIRSFDTMGEPEEKIFRRIVRQIRPGGVILLHDRMPGTASLLRRLLEYLKMNNYQVILLNEMFTISGSYDEEL